MTEPIRYSDRPFPPYTYVPGEQPHPVSDPRGHMHGHEEPDPPLLEPERWQESETYLYAVDLFNHGYYWEAHEAWESLWLAAGRAGTTAEFLKGLIKLAAAGVKRLEDNSTGVQRHTARGVELLSGVAEITETFCGIELQSVLKSAGNAEQCLTLEGFG